MDTVFVFLALIAAAAYAMPRPLYDDDDCPHQMRDGRCEWCGFKEVRHDLSGNDREHGVPANGGEQHQARSLNHQTNANQRGGLRATGEVEE